MKSIQSRLTIGLIVSLLSLFIILWALVSFNIQKLAEDYTASRLQHDIETLLSAIVFDDKGIMSINKNHINPIYNRPFSGHYFIIRNQLSILRSRSLWDQMLVLEDSLPGKFINTYQNGPENQPLIVVTSEFSKSKHQIIISVAEDLTPLKHNIQYFKNTFVFTTAMALVLLLTLQIIVLRKGLKPLQKIKHELVELEQGDISNLSNNVPTELKPVINEINHLLSILHKRLNRSRDALSDLSHAIKKPLTVLHQLVSDNNLVSYEDEIKKQLVIIQKLTDRILKRARFSGNFNTGALFDFNYDLNLLLKTVKSMYPLKEVDVILNITDNINMPIDREDMLELLGNLIDNAYKWASGKIIISIYETGYLYIVIEDDGPGCESQSVKQLSKRGVRLDETTSGHGFGLAICTDMVNDYEGELSFHRSELLAGFKVKIMLPIHHI